MKRRIFAVCIIIMLLLCGCARRDESSTDSKNAPVSGKDMTGLCSKGLWISFSEINAMLKSEKGFKEEFQVVLENCLSLDIENIYVHVRAYCDSLFESQYFPLINDACDYDFDTFEYILTACHQKGIKVHAWINPYRVLTSSDDINKLNEKSPARRWLTDDNPANDLNVCIYNGIYLNPAEHEVRQLVINGIREVITKYDVDGIHFDDYFYPTTDETFDAQSYKSYCESTENPLALDEWRRANVNALISGCYTAVKFMNKDIVFSISPMASVETNYSQLYADVAAWIENGCVDVIIPQLYFGFDYPNEEYKFMNLFKQWKELCENNKEVKLLIGLGAYKIGTDSPNDTEEWNSETDIIYRQAEICRADKQVAGYVLFSYTAVFSDQPLNTTQRENLKKGIKDSTLS